MKKEKISTRKRKFCLNEKDEIINIIYNSSGISHTALSRLTGSDTYRMLHRMTKSGVIKEKITTLFSKKKGSVFYVDKLDIAKTKTIDLISWAPFFFRSNDMLVGKVTIQDKGIKFPVFDNVKHKQYTELNAESLNIDSNSDNKSSNLVYVTDNRQKFLEYVDEEKLPKNAIFIVLFKEGDSQFLTAYHSYKKIEKLDMSQLFSFVETKKIFDPEFFKQTEKRYYKKQVVQEEKAEDS